SKRPDYVLTENNRSVLNQTQANAVPTAQFEFFEGAQAIDPDPNVRGRALYFGFTKPFDVRPLALFVDAEEREGKTELLFEVLAQDGWRLVRSEDQTYGFHRTGLVRVYVDVKPRRARYFGQELYWLRVRPRVDNLEWAPHLKGVFVNAGMAQQAKSVQQEVLGSSLGKPNFRVYLSQKPVLSGSLELRVREALGEEEQQALTEADPEGITRYENIPGDWVLWKRVDSFIGADGHARIYRLDPVSGEVRFGDGQQGRIPPAGRDAIRAIGYQSGGGEPGNVDAFTIKALKSAVESVENVANPVAASGGVDTPTVDALIVSAPARLRHNQQALTPFDMEALAVGSSPAIVRARCLVPVAPGEPIKVVIAKRGDERCTQSLADRDALARFLRERAWGGLDEGEILVTGPRYVKLAVTVELLATSSQQVAALERAADERLKRLFHPTDGGPDGSGWPFGRRVWESDVLRALADLPGLDRVEKLRFDPKEGTSLDALSPTALICAEEADIQVTASFQGGGN
ncbi:MAG: putative baseplate assembly protein, partial [Gammaproteobacteria bacterium]